MENNRDNKEKISQNYIMIMHDSLKKKLVVLEAILMENHKQQLSVGDGKFDEPAFEATLARKEELINQLEELDTGFQSLFDRVKDDLNLNSHKYAVEIQEMKELITKISQKSMEVELSEKRNESLMTKKFGELKREVHQSKNASKVASSYSQNMQGMGAATSQYVDSKK